MEGVVLRLVTFTLLMLCLVPAVFADDGQTIETTPAGFRLSIDNLTLSGGERMGLLGGTILYNVNDWFRLGPGAYGAITGQRGGFITLGGAAEVNVGLAESFALHGGVFVGAGGGHGGYQLQGGGLMLRGHLAGDFDLGSTGHVGAGWSYVDFPNGSVHSGQPYLYYEYPFTALLTHGWPERSNALRSISDVVGLSESEFAAVYREASVPAGVMNDLGTKQYPKVQLMGVEWLRYLGEYGFVKMEAAGAMGGQSNGYMQILLGGGLRWILTGSTALKVAAGAGVAGGGNVSTGGGLMLNGSVSVQQMLYNGLYFEVGGGYLNAPDGQFRATTVTAKLGYNYEMPDVREPTVSTTSLSGFQLRKIRLRLTGQRYLQGDPKWRTHHADLSVLLLGGQVDYFVFDNVYVTGQGIGASQGQAGGYMTGLIGAGIHQSLFGMPLFVDVEALGGAAGGGGLAVGGGLVWQVNGSLGYQLTDAYSLIAGGGYISAPGGDFKARVLSLSLGYQFGFYTR